MTESHRTHASRPSRTVSYSMSIKTLAPEMLILRYENCLGKPFSSTGSSNLPSLKIKTQSFFPSERSSPNNIWGTIRSSSQNLKILILRSAFCWGNGHAIYRLGKLKSSIFECQSHVFERSSPNTIKGNIHPLKTFILRTSFCLGNGEAIFPSGDLKSSIFEHQIPHFLVN